VWRGEAGRGRADPGGDGGRRARAPGTARPARLGPRGQPPRQDGGVMDPRRALRSVSTALYWRPRVSLALLLGPPLLWLGVVYLGSLASLVVQSFFRLD